MIELPTEIYYLIFYNLKNDFHGLFTCTRVNRTWCENVIPILWSEPDLHFRDKKLTQVLFLTLNAEEQTLLIPFNIIGSGQERPLFNYTNFIRSIPKDHLYYGIKNWLLPLKDTGICGTHQPRIQNERKQKVTEKPVTDELRQDAVTCSLIAMLLRTSANLKKFYINDEIICNQLIFKKLCETTSITSLDVHYTNEVMDGLEIFLNNNSTLTTFNFKSKESGAEKMKKLVKALCKITALNFLDLHVSRISTEEECKILGKFLEKNTTLTSLALNDNYLKSDVGLVEAILKNTALIFLDLGNTCLRTEGGRMLADALQKNTSLTSLNISNNQLSLEVGRALADVLCRNSTLISLNISYNHLGSEGGKYLADALCKNISLKDLNLECIEIGLEGGIALANALCTNTTLISLNICCNKLGSEVGKAFANAICKNISLKNLNLQNNEIGLEGGIALANALCTNTTLTSLNLCWNQLGSKVGQALANAICKGISLKVLNLRNNEIGSKEGKALEGSLRKNTTLISLDLRLNDITFKIKSNNKNIEILQ